MRALLSFLLLLTTASSVLAALSAAEQAARGTPFRIRAKAVRGQKSNFDGLYIERASSNNGQYAVIFSKISAVYFKLQETELRVRLQRPGLKHKLVVSPTNDVYAQWDPMLLSINKVPKYYKEGFMFDQNGFIINNQTGSSLPFTPEWAQWRVCEWNHEQPELFWDYFTGSKLTANCEFVQLVAEFFID